MVAYREEHGGLSRWLVRGLSRLLVLVLAFGAGAVAMHVGMHAGDHEHMQALQARNTALQDQLTQAQADLAALKNQSDVGDGAQRALQDKLAALQKTLGDTQDQLSFYEQLLPSGPAGTVSIRAADVQPQGDFLRYRVLLTRSAPDASDPFKGRLRFVATGRQNGKTVKIDLSTPQASDAAPTTDAANASAPAPAAADPLALSFDQYQRSTGVLQMVPGLTLQSVRVDVLEGDAVRASQDVTPGAAGGTGASQ
jgi:hypothetical protein